MKSLYQQFASSLFLQLIKPYISFKKKIIKLTTTGIYDGFSNDANIHNIINTISFVAYPSAKYDVRNIVRQAAKKLVVIEIVLSARLGVSNAHKII